MVHITARGRDTYSRAVADIRKMEADVLTDLTSAERKTLLAVLPRLASG